VLAVGQSWKQNGVILTLDEVGYDGDIRTGITFILKNNTSAPLLVSCSSATFSLEDNLGKRYERRPSSDWNCGSGALDPGELWKCVVAFTGTPLDLRIEYLIVTVNEFSRFQNARWKIEVYH